VARPRRLGKHSDQRTVKWAEPVLFHFAVTKPLAMGSQGPPAGPSGRREDAEDHDLMSTLVLNELLRAPVADQSAGQACQ
jgi:hypothetical protein